MQSAALPVLIDLARLGARRFTRQLGIGAFSLQHAFPAALRSGALACSATGRMGRRAHALPLTTGRGTVRPNKSFKPMPLRGTA